MCFMLAPSTSMPSDCPSLNSYCSVIIIKYQFLVVSSLRFGYTLISCFLKTFKHGIHLFYITHFRSIFMTFEFNKLLVCELHSSFFKQISQFNYNRKVHFISKKVFMKQIRYNYRNKI